MEEVENNSSLVNDGGECCVQSGSGSGSPPGGVDKILTDHSARTVFGLGLVLGLRPVFVSFCVLCKFCK